jgi:hypothetical protein
MVKDLKGFFKTFQVSDNGKEKNIMRATQRRCRYLLVISVIMLIWLSAGVAYSQSSANYQIERSVLDAGGGDRSSMNYGMCDSLGQPSGTTISTSSNYIHTPGFYECEVFSGSLPTPTPTPQPIPEPGTLILVGIGLIGVLAFGKRKLKKRR